MTKDLVSIDDLSAEEAAALLDLAVRLKSGETAGELPRKSLALVFEKPSLRTRVTFEVAMTQLGGHAVYLSMQDIGLGERESVRDVAQNLSQWVDGIAARTFAHDTVRKLAEHATIPVINALCNVEHPCQALADFLTLIECRGTATGATLAYVGDGNNVCHSLMLLAAKLGTHMRVGCPDGYRPDDAVARRSEELAAKSGGSLVVTEAAQEAVSGADAVYTDVWTSMGDEAQAHEREKVFRPYQVNAALLTHAKPDAIVLHCLPAHRGDEITDEVIDGPQSVVLQQAQNRLYVQKAVLVELLK